MNSSPLTQQIVDLRKSKGLSQERLAELASINLRTLQRIEKGETEPRGDTLRLIAAALEVPVERLFCSPEKKGEAGSDRPEKEDKSFLQFLNLSALSSWIIPLGNVFVPMFLWHIKKDQVKGVRTFGKAIINFQITWSLAFLLFFCGSLLKLPFFPPILSWLLLPLFNVWNTIAILRASYQLARGSEKIFSASIKIIR